MPATIIRIALPVPLPRLFDYLPPADGPLPLPGCRLRVPFGNGERTGVVIEHAATTEVPADKLVAVAEVLDDGAPLLDAEQLALLRWAWRYYKHPPGQVVFNALPAPLRQPGRGFSEPPPDWELTEAGRERLAEGPGRAPAQFDVLRRLAGGPVGQARLAAAVNDWSRLRRLLVERGWIASRPPAVAAAEPAPGPDLHPEQRSAADAVRADLGRFAVHLLDGVTGSGKTEVYLDVLRTALADGGQALVLVPEIGLTPQLVRRFRDRLGIEPWVSHSGCSEGERLATWQAAREGRARLIIGTRSALFLPLPQARLLVIDEEHDPSLRQQDGFRYSARDVAVKRAAGLEVPIVLGTATPSLESLHNARRSRYRHHLLRERATGAPMPAWRVVDLRGQPVEDGLAGGSVEAIEATLGRGEQVLVFLNRRGYAPVLLCHECGWHAACRHCDAHLTWHHQSARLRCHHCGAEQAVPRLCPDCRADALQGAGQGTERLERSLARRFPGVPLWRFDRDTTRGKSAFEERSAAVRAGEAGLLVGTQMLAKGHHFPAVTLVVIVDLDQALFSADFRAIERMGQVMIQVAGRAGRAERPGTVLLQTHCPEHPALGRLIGEGYHAFAGDLLEERLAAGLPPAGHLAMLRAEANDKERVVAFLERAAALWPEGPARLGPPLPALMERRAGRYRWYLLAQAAERSRLHGQLDRWWGEIRGLPASRRVRWTLDVDPVAF